MGAHRQGFGASAARAVRFSGIGLIFSKKGMNVLIDQPHLSDTLCDRLRVHIPFVQEDIVDHINSRGPDDRPLTRRGFGLAAGRMILGLLGLALIPLSTTGHSTRQRSPKLRIGGPIPAGMAAGTLCIVTSGEDVAPGVSAGHVVRFVSAPIPGTSKAIFLYAPGKYAYSHSDGRWVGKDNAHNCCLIDRTRLRLLERWERADV